MVTTGKFARLEVKCGEQSRAIEQRVGSVSRLTLLALLDCSQGQFHSHQRDPPGEFLRLEAAFKLAGSIPSLYRDAKP